MWKMASIRQEKVDSYHMASASCLVKCSIRLLFSRYKMEGLCRVQRSPWQHGLQRIAAVGRQLVFDLLLLPYLSSPLQAPPFKPPLKPLKPPFKPSSPPGPFKRPPSAYPSKPLKPFKPLKPPFEAFEASLQGLQGLSSLSTPPPLEALQALEASPLKGASDPPSARASEPATGAGKVEAWEAAQPCGAGGVCQTPPDSAEHLNSGNSSPDRAAATLVTQFDMVSDPSPTQAARPPTQCDYDLALS